MTMEMKLDLHTFGDQLKNNTKEKNGDDWKKGGRLLSGLMGSNVLLFGGALATCVYTEDVDIFEFDFLVFLSIMMVISISWMIFQMYFTWKHKNAVLFKDCEAGPIWMRGGVILFGLGTLIMTSVKIVHAVDHKDCISPIKFIYPIILAIFVIVQTCFLWITCKHCVQIYRNTTRCFLMVLLTVNLISWIIAVAEEAKHHTNELLKHLQGNESENTADIISEKEEEYENLNTCACRSLCKIITTTISYLYPFNIEYNLFAAAMLYIMWKNVGRQIDESASHYHGIGPGICKHIPLLGLVSGLVILIIGLAMFILYEMSRDTNHAEWFSLTTFYIFHVVSLILMCLANIVGLIIFQIDKRSMDNEKNPSRTLDMALLLLATLGQYSISYYSIIAMVSTQPFSVLSGLTLSYSFLMIFQHSIQNFFIIEGLHRLPPNVLFRPSRHTEPHETIKQIDMEKRQSLTGAPTNSNQKMTRRETLTAQIKTHLKKRKTMKDIYLFLFLTNIIFWIMPAFGARIRFDNGLEVNFYGFSLWAIITNVCLPFGIFYRTHAAACLLELYSMA
ncbi:proton channel OTOP2-like isoform X1 [Bufo bufo]|uniref:proton channel OTOP2-like isoform X1 n=1 Tax=Bufo bufo TaxID=8384 RepID=UPI001ABE5AE0|nr:proton channel OTOP2-like isoform X1 [Bufo bufo]